MTRLAISPFILPRLEVEREVGMLHKQEEWLAANSVEIAEKIE